MTNGVYPLHGYYVTYIRGCRCDPCKQAGSAYYTAYRRRVKDRWRSDPMVIQHGRTGYYFGKCRCQTCKTAHAADSRTQRTKARRGSPSHERPASPRAPGE